MNRRRVIRGIAVCATTLLVAYAGYKAWWTPAIGGEPTSGETAPDFTLLDQSGTAHTLSRLLNQGPVVVSFYRGYW